MRFWKLSYCVPALCLFFYSLSSCKKDIHTEQEILSFVSDPSNGLSKKVQKGSISLEVVSRPKDLIIIQEIKGQGYNEMQIDSVREKFDSLDYFLLRMSRNNQEVLTAYASNAKKFNDASNYLSFGIGNDIILINDFDTIYVEDFIHTRMFGTSTTSDIMLVFKSCLQKRRGKFTIQFNDNLLGTGFTEFEFHTEKIRNIPSIDTNQIVL